MKTLYEILGVEREATHEEIKRAFRTRAMAVHPDRNPSLCEAGERFKEVAEAYETLSDVHKRAAYDLRVLGARSAVFDHGVRVEDLASAGESVLDTLVDDTLEELVVGNEPPRKTSLRTFFLDLERTENFILLRDGKEAFFTRHYARAASVFERAREGNPHNILILYYLGRACGELGRWEEAEKFLRQGVRLGQMRVPPNGCPGVRRALLRVYRRRGKKLRARWLERENAMLASMQEDEADAMAASLGRAMARLDAEQLARAAQRKQIGE